MSRRSYQGNRVRIPDILHYLLLHPVRHLETASITQPSPLTAQHRVKAACVGTNLVPASPCQPPVTITIIAGEREEREERRLIITFVYITISPYKKAIADITPAIAINVVVLDVPDGGEMTGVIIFVIR